MPIYRYRCEDGHENETLRQVADRNNEFPCPQVIVQPTQMPPDNGPPLDLCGKPTKLIPPTNVNAKVIGGTPKFH